MESMNLLLLTAHDIAEYDDLRMLSEMGHDVFSIGGYTDPAHPASDLRPPLAVKRFPELRKLCLVQREKHAGETGWPFDIDWAKSDLHPDIIDWADAIICHHYPEPWLKSQWGRIRHKRVIWRTCGQSDTRLEAEMRPLHDDGLQVVRYSPKEAEWFTSQGVFAGQDALIRFGKEPSEWGGWTGETRIVANVTQNMVDRGEHVGLGFWWDTTRDLPAVPAGIGSDKLPGGLGSLDFDAMKTYLRQSRAYLFTGTQPASYTLAFIEAMMTGTPIVAMGPSTWWVPALMETHELATLTAESAQDAVSHLRMLLNDSGYARATSTVQRQKAIDLFGMDGIKSQWSAFLAKVPVAA